MTELKGFFGVAEATPLQNKPHPEFFSSLLGRESAVPISE
jgi:hypothetical protein